MTGAVVLITTRQLGISRREFSTPTERRDDHRSARRSAASPSPSSRADSSSSPRPSCSASTGSTRSRRARSSSPSRSSRRVPRCSSATVVSNEHQLSALGPALGMILGLLGGTMVPIEVFPDVMRTLSHVTPHAWAMDAFHRLLLDGGGLAGRPAAARRAAGLRGRPAGARVVPLPPSGHRWCRLSDRPPLVSRCAPR